jgi:hypothetical protein
MGRRLGINIQVYVQCLSLNVTAMIYGRGIRKRLNAYVYV